MKMIRSAGILVLGLALFSCQSAPLSTSNPAPAIQSQSATSARLFGTAKSGLWRADSTARRWDNSARLSKVEARWVDEDGSSFDWIYYFTALGKDKAFKVEGSRGTEVSGFFGSSIWESSWRIDSEQALAKAKEKGLKNFPVFSMELDGFMTWEIQSSNGFFRVDARSGQVSQ